MNSQDNKGYVYFSMGYGGYPVIKFSSATELNAFRQKLRSKVSQQEMDNEMFETEGTDLVFIYSNQNTNRVATRCEQAVYEVLGSYRTKTNALKEDITIRDAFKGCFSENLTHFSSKERADSMSKLYGNNRENVKQSELNSYLNPVLGPQQQAGSDKVLYAFNYLSSEDMAKGLFYPEEPKTPKTGLRFLNEIDKNIFMQDLVNAMNRSHLYELERQKYGKNLDIAYLNKLNVFIPAEEYYLDDRGNPTDANGILLKKGERLVGKPDSEKVKNTVYIARPRGSRDRIDGDDKFRGAFSTAAEAWFTPVQCCSKFFDLRQSMHQTLHSLGDGTVKNDKWMADGSSDKMIIFGANGEIIDKNTITDILKSKRIPRELYDPNFVRQPDYAAAMKKLEKDLPTYEESTLSSNSANPPSYEGATASNYNTNHTNVQQPARRSPSPQRPSSAELIRIEKAFVDQKLYLVPGFESNAFNDLSVDGLQDFILSVRNLLNGKESSINTKLANKIGVNYDELKRLIPDPKQRGQKIMAKKGRLLEEYLNEATQSAKNNSYMASEEKKITMTSGQMQEAITLYKALTNQHVH